MFHLHYTTICNINPQQILPCKRHTGQLFKGKNHQVNSAVIEFQFDGIFINPIISEYSFLLIVENKLSSRNTIHTDGRNFQRNDFCTILKYFDLTDWPLDARFCVCVDT